MHYYKALNGGVCQDINTFFWVIISLNLLPSPSVNPLTKLSKSDGWICHAGSEVGAVQER